MGWSYEGPNSERSGLDSKWDKVKGPPPSKKTWKVFDVAKVRVNDQKPVEIAEVEDIPVRGGWHKNGYRVYWDTVINYGSAGRRCYLTVRIDEKNYNVHVPDTPSWGWLRNAIFKIMGGNKNK